MQYSIWPKEREIPLGWKAEGMEGTYQKCLEYIENEWKDMWPMRLKKSREDAENNKDIN